MPRERPDFVLHTIILLGLGALVSFLLNWYARNWAPECLEAPYVYITTAVGCVAVLALGLAWSLWRYRDNSLRIRLLMDMVGGIGFVATNLMQFFLEK